MTTRYPTLLLASWLVALFLPGASRAQEIQWRQDYAQARKEAQDKVRLLVIDLGTENCFWCKQLDARTFTDPEVAALLNDKCIPLRISAESNPRLVEALRIQSYPTLVFAAPDGKILGYQEGFLEAPALKQQLSKLLAQVSAPDWMVRDFQDATRAIESGDHARALTLLHNVVEDGRDRPVQTRARQLLRDLEKQAEQQCVRAKEQADGGKVKDALGTLNRLVQDYPGTLAARQGREMLFSLTSRTRDGDEQRTRRVRELLQQARDDYRAQEFLCCLDRCEAIVAGYADLPESAEASQLASEIKSNPEWTRQACDQLGDRLSVLYLSLADTWLKKGQPQQAVFYLERVVQTFPNTRHAEAAQARLTQIQGPSSRGSEGKK